jgi:hypothetical protein
MAADHQTDSLEARATRAKAEGEMFQAELDYRLAGTELNRVLGNMR